VLDKKPFDCATLTIILFFLCFFNHPCLAAPAGEIQTDKTSLKASGSIFPDKILILEVTGTDTEEVSSFTDILRSRLMAFRIFKEIRTGGADADYRMHVELLPGKSKIKGGLGPVTMHTKTTANVTLVNLSTGATILSGRVDGLASLTHANFGSKRRLIKESRIKCVETLSSKLQSICVEAYDVTQLPTYQGDNPRISVAVIPFQDSTSEARREGLGDAAAAFLTTAMAHTQRFDLVERQHLDKIMKELALSQHGMFSQENAIRLGELLNAQLIVTGSVSKLSDIVEMDIRVIDISSGKVVLTANDRVNDSRKLRSCVNNLAIKILATSHFLEF